MNLARAMFLLTAGMVRAAGAGDNPDQLPNLQGKTLGGTQFWSDVLVHRGWRIQRNSWTKHYRLLDDDNVRRAWGSHQSCRLAFDKMQGESALSPVGGKVVVVLHGLGRTRHSMEPICRFLNKSGEFTVINITYASTRESIGTHAASLLRILEYYKDAEEINFVAHSMGNLVIRHFLADQIAKGPDALPGVRAGRFVMLAPPNQGSYLARLARGTGLFQILCGTSGQQVTAESPEWIELTQRLATPQCEFAIVAGRGGSDGGNPLLQGKDDLVVTVEETRLAGARDFVVVPAVHTFLMNDADVQRYVLNFLRHGYLVSEDKRQPIPRDSRP